MLARAEKNKAQVQRRQDRKEMEPKALVEITVTWHNPDATAEGKWWRSSRKMRSPRVLYLTSVGDDPAQVLIKLPAYILQALQLP